MSGAKLLLPLYAFMATTGTNLPLFSHYKDGDSGLLPVYQATQRHTPAHRYIDTVRLEHLTFHYHRAITLHTTHDIDKVWLNYTTFHRTLHNLRLQ